MKKIILLCLLHICTVYSQTYQMNICMKGGNTTSIPIEDIQKITFSDISTIIKNERLSTVIKTFRLFQNYPNPFNPNTTIKYQLPKAGNVEIKIFNVNGQLIKLVNTKQQSIGVHTFAWDGKNADGQALASGIYFYQINFENSILTNKMLYLK